MTREELKTATNDELIYALNYCGYDSYYRDYRDDIVAEIKKRMQEPILDKIRAELIQCIQNGTLKIESGNEELFRIFDKYKAEAR